jgi:ubiquinone/menaquinone biosynthesis C-methylase UbiE
MTMTHDQTEADRALKAKHRAMWALGDYPAVARDIVGDLGPVLVRASGVGPGERVLDVAAGSGNASIPAAAAGATVVASDLTPELFETGRKAAARAGVEVDWQQADAEALPYPDASFDTVLSCLGVMFAPHHQAGADELVRVLRPGGTLGLLSWTPEGFIGQMFATMKPYAPAPPPGAQPPPLWGSEDHVRELFGDRVDFHTVERDMLEVTAFKHPHEYGEHFKERYGPTIAARANAAKDGREAELDTALDAFCDEWNLGSDDEARFEQEYLLTVGTTRAD